MTPPLQELEWVRPPLQARSAQTLERLLDAAEVLIAERGADKTTVAEIAKRAESSVGAFYARFPDKDALLRTVAERFYQQAVDTVESVLQPERWGGYALAEVVESAVAFLIKIFYEKRRLVRAISTRAADDEVLEGLGEHLGEVVAERMLALLAHRGDPIGHPKPEQAVRLSVWMVMAAFHARCMYSDDSPAPIPEAKLAQEVTRMCLSYLELPEE